VPRPNRTGTFYLEGYRTPKAALAASDDEPEINGQHHCPGAGAYTAHKVARQHQ